MTTATMPQGRIPLAFVVVNGQRIPCIIDLEWARYLDALNQNLVANGSLSNDILATQSFLPNVPTYQAAKALEGNSNHVFEAESFGSKQPTFQAMTALEGNSNAILASQIYGG